MTFSSIRKSWYSRFISFCLTITFITTMVITPKAQAGVMGLPQPGTMVNLSPAYVPLMITGLTVHPKNPLLMDFIVSTGNSGLDAARVKKESDRLIKYFLACLTIPEGDQWVNLSPYEKQRIVPEDLGQTVLGQDMLAQDYLLKQLTASLIYPEKNLGKDFWDKVYAKAGQMYGTTQIPVNTFNKVWILPSTAQVFEHKDTVFVVKSHLKVMLDEDYLALSKHQRQPAKAPQGNNHPTNTLASNIVRQIILPAIEKEVNYGQNFAQLRQIYNSMILAVWFKKNLKEALLNQVYTDKSKVNGVNVDDPSIKERIYKQYLEAYKKGVFNYIKEETDQTTQETIPRKYFSGGITAINAALITPATSNEAMASFRDEPEGNLFDDVRVRLGKLGSSGVNAAMTVNNARYLANALYDGSLLFQESLKDSSYFRLVEILEQGEGRDNTDYFNIGDAINHKEFRVALGLVKRVLDQFHKDLQGKQFGPSQYGGMELLLNLERDLVKLIAKEKGHREDNAMYVADPVNMEIANLVGRRDFDYLATHEGMMQLREKIQALTNENVGIVTVPSNLDFPEQIVKIYAIYQGPEDKESTVYPISKDVLRDMEKKRGPQGFPRMYRLAIGKLHTYYLIYGLEMPILISVQGQEVQTTQDTGIFGGSNQAMTTGASDSQAKIEEIKTLAEQFIDGINRGLSPDRAFKYVLQPEPEEGGWRITFSFSREKTAFDNDLDFIREKQEDLILILRQHVHGIKFLKARTSVFSTGNKYAESIIEFSNAAMIAQGPVHSPNHGTDHLGTATTVLYEGQTSTPFPFDLLVKGLRLSLHRNLDVLYRIYRKAENIVVYRIKGDREELKANIHDGKFYKIDGFMVSLEDIDAVKSISVKNDYGQKPLTFSLGFDETPQSAAMTTTIPADTRWVPVHVKNGGSILLKGLSRLYQVKISNGSIILLGPTGRVIDGKTIVDKKGIVIFLSYKRFTQTLLVNNYSHLDLQAINSANQAMTAGKGIKIGIVIADAPEDGNIAPMDAELDKTRALYPGAEITIVKDAVNAGKDGADALMGAIRKAKQEGGYDAIIVIVRSFTTAFTEEKYLKEASENGVKLILRSGVGITSINKILAARKDINITVARTHGSANSVADEALYLASLVYKMNVGDDFFRNTSSSPVLPGSLWQEIAKTSPEDYLRLIDKKFSEKFPKGYENLGVLKQEYLRGVMPYLNTNNDAVINGLGHVFNGQVFGMIGLGPIPITLMGKNRILIKNGVQFKEIVDWTRSFFDADPNKAAARKELAAGLGMVPEDRQEMLKRATILSLHVDEPDAQLTEAELDMAEHLKVIINTAKIEAFPLNLMEKFLIKGGVILGDLDLKPNNITKILELMHRFPGQLIILPHLGASTLDGKEGVEINTLPSLREGVELMLGHKPETNVMEIMNNVPITALSASAAMTATDMHQFNASFEEMASQYKASADIRKTTDALMQFSDDFNYIILDGTPEAQKVFNNILVKKSIFAKTVASDWINRTDKTSPEYNEFVSTILQRGFASIEAFGQKMVASGVAKKSSIDGAIKLTKVLLPQWLDANNNVPKFIIAGIIRGLLEGRDEDLLYCFGKDWRMFGTAGIRNQAVQSSFGVIADLELSEFAEGPHATILTGPNLMNVLTIIQQQQAIVNVYQEIQNANREGKIEQLIKEKNLDRRFVEDVINNNKVSIAYDSRLNGKYFAHMLASGFLQAGIDVDLFDRPSGVPAVIYQGAEDPAKRSAMGILMSASHSEANYNGFKAFLMVYRSQVDNAGKNMVVGQRPAIVGEPAKNVVVVPYKMHSELGSMSLEDFDRIFEQHASATQGTGRLKWISDEEFNPTTNRVGADVDNQFFVRYYKHIQELSPVNLLGLPDSAMTSVNEARQSMRIFYTAFMGGGAVNAQDFPGFLKRMGYSQVYINENQTLRHNGSFAGFNKPGGLFGMPDPGVTQGWIVNFVEFLQQEAGRDLDETRLQAAIDLMNSFTVGLATDPDIDRGGIELSMEGMRGGNIKASLLDAVKEKLNSQGASTDHVARVIQLLNDRLNDSLLLTANDAWTFIVFHKLRMMIEAGKMSKDKLYIIEKSHVTTDALNYVADYYRNQGYHVCVVDTYVGFTELAKKSRDLYKIAKLAWFIHQHLASSNEIRLRPQFLRFLYDQLLELNAELKRNVMYERRGVPMIDEAINKLGRLINGGRVEMPDVMSTLSIVAHMEIPMGVEESNGYGEFGAFIPNENFVPQALGSNYFTDWSSDNIGHMEREHISEKDGSLAAYEFAELLALGKAREGKTPFQMYLDVFKAIGAVGTDNRFVNYVGLTGEDKKLGAMEWFEKTLAVLLKEAVDDGKEVTMFNGRYKVKDVQVYRDAKYDVFGIGFPEEGVRLILESNDGSTLFATFRPSGTGANNRDYSWVFGAKNYKGKNVSEMSYEELNDYRMGIVDTLNQLAKDFFGIQDKTTGYAHLEKHDFHGLMSALGEMSFDQYDSTLAKVIDQPELTRGFTSPNEIALRAQAEEFAKALREFTDQKTGVVDISSRKYQQLTIQNAELWSGLVNDPIFDQYPSDKRVEIRLNEKTILAIPRAYAIGWQTSMIDFLAATVGVLITKIKMAGHAETLRITSNDPEVLALMVRRYGNSFGNKINFGDAAMNARTNDLQREVDPESEGIIPDVSVKRAIQQAEALIVTTNAGMTTTALNVAKILPAHSKVPYNGGIDLNSGNLKMESSGKKVDITFDPAMIAQFKRGDFSGVRIQILDVVPVNLMPLLGLKEEEELGKLAKA